MDDLLEGLFSLVFIILLAGLVIYGVIYLIAFIIHIALMILLYVVLPGAAAFAYGWMCLKLGRILFGRYRHTSKSKVTLSVIAIASYAASILLLRSWFPGLNIRELVLLLALLPGALIFLLAGLLVSETWAYCRKFRPSNELLAMRSNEEELTDRLNFIENQAHNYHKEMIRLMNLEKAEKTRIEGMKKSIDSWAMKDPANRGLLLKKWRESGGHQGLTAGFSEEHQSIINNLKAMKLATDRIRIARKQKESIQAKISQLESRKSEITNHLNQFSIRRKILERQVEIMQKEKPVLN